MLEIGKRVRSQRRGRERPHALWDAINKRGLI